jgi:hypothetical protein
MKIARPVLQGRVKSVEVERTAEVEFAKEVQGALRQTVLTKQCSSASGPFLQPVVSPSNFRIVLLRSSHRMELFLVSFQLSAHVVRI